MDYNITPGIKAEWHHAKDVLVSKPQHELFLGILHPGAASFESSFDPLTAMREYDTFLESLNDEGVNVIQISEVLKSHPDILRILAEESLEYVYLDSNGQRKEVEEDSTLKVEIINNLPNETLIRIVLEKPEVWQIQDKHFKDQHHTLSYRLNPIANHYFQRDPMITTDKGAVVGRMTNEVRKKENDLAEIILDLIGAKPIYIVQEPGNLEGGDYIPAEEFALLGEGLRTNMHAINQLLENNVFDFPEIAIVHDPYKQQDEMHLDTYFEFIGEKKAFIVEDRITTKENKPNPSKVPFVTLYKQNQDKSYSQYTENGELSFQSYLESKNIELVPLPKEMQLNYGNNILTISPNKIIAVKNVAETYPSLLSQNNVLFTEVDLENISKGYGGPHCMTQVLRREKN